MRVMFAPYDGNINMMRVTFAVYDVIFAAYDGTNQNSKALFP